METHTPKVLQIGIVKDTGGGAGIMQALTTLPEVIDTLSFNLSVREILKLRRYLQSHQIDIIQSHGTRASTLVRLTLATIRTRPKHVYTVHGFHISYKRGMKRHIMLRIERLLNRWTDHMVAVSSADKRQILKTNCFQKEHITIIPNGIDNHWFTQKNATDRSSLKRKEDDVLLLHVSRLHPQKDLSTAIMAMKYLPPTHHLLIVGTGRRRAKLETQVQTEHLEQQVHFLGRRHDVPELMRMADALILSSHWEGCPLVILEAMASKLPVIASNVNGNKELVIDKKTGRLFEHMNPESLATIILEHTFNKHDKQTEFAYTVVQKDHTQETMQKRYLTLWHACLTDL